MKSASLSFNLVWFETLFLSLLKSVIIFPFIYYSRGLKEVAAKARYQIFWFERLLAFRLSVRTLFSPLYGDYTKQGRIVGLVIRFGLLLFRGLGLALVLIVISALFILYAMAPVIILLVIFRPLWS